MVAGDCIIDNGGANSVTIPGSTVTDVRQILWSSKYAVGANHATHEFIGHGDRVFTVIGGPLTEANRTSIEAICDGGAAVNFYAPATSSANLSVIVVQRQYSYGAALSTANIYVQLILKEVG
jgi:hypothetical protein